MIIGIWASLAVGFSAARSADDRNDKGRASREAEVQLHKIDSDKYAFIMPAAPVIVIATFTDGTIITGVNSLNADSASGGARYNLMGQPVDDNYKGIVIQNGTKKVIR